MALQSLLWTAYFRGLDMRKIRLKELAEIERGKNKIYPAGCTLIPLSASSLELIKYMPDADEIGGRFAVVIPHEGVVPEYLFISIMRAAPEFFHKYQTTINLQYETLLEYYLVDFDEDVHVQLDIANKMKILGMLERKEEEVIKELKELKRTFLSKMFI